MFFTLLFTKNVPTNGLASVTAKSGYYKDIQDAIDQIVKNNSGIGNVYIPAGTFNFHNPGEAWTPVHIPAGVNLFGAPTARDSSNQVTSWNTVLVMSYEVPSCSGDSPTSTGVWFTIGDGLQDPGRPSRFSDIKLQGYRSINPASTTQHQGILIYGVMNFRVDHCAFEHTCAGAIALPCWFTQNMKCNGVIDHNRIYNLYGYDDLANYLNSNIGYGIELHRAYNPPGGGPMPFDATMNVLGKYTDHTVFIEDNYFSLWRHVVSSGHGAFYVFRYNKVNNDDAHFSLDVHGLRDLEAGRAGGRGMEVYENVFTNAQPSQKTGQSFGGLFQTGGGCGVWFNNYVDSSYKQASIYAEDAVASLTWHVADFYVWSGRGTGSVTVSFPRGVIDPVRDVFVDWGRLAGSRLDANYPNVDSSWSIAGYKPYQYPHPLASK